jgi:hypothetical protein
MLSHFKYSKQLSIVVVVFIAIFSSCSKPKSTSNLAEYGSAFETIMQTDTGTFRGFNLGNHLDSVKAKEISKLIEMDESYLYYESKIDDSTGTFNISYTFDDGSLTEIQSDIFVNSQEHTDSLFSQFKNYFDKHYGPSEMHGGYNVWTVKSMKFDDVRINLSDESTDFTVDKAPGKISLWIYPDKE